MVDKLQAVKEAIKDYGDARECDCLETADEKEQALLLTVQDYALVEGSEEMVEAVANPFCLMEIGGLPYSELKNSQWKHEREKAAEYAEAAKAAIRTINQQRK